MRVLPLRVIGVLAATSLALSAQRFGPPGAVDTNPDPNIVEYTISANVTTWQFQPGVDTTVWAYSDDSPSGVGAAVPGPTLKGNVGDLMIVHFTNNLPEETTVHWHGIEVPADQDGSHISQLAVQPGESFEYRFVLPRDGLYWYHPHVRPFDGVERGLHAMVLVKNPVRDAIVLANLGARTYEERIVVFDDVLLDEDGEVVPAFSFTDPLQNALYHLNGRVGNVLLVNGKDVGSTGYPLTVTNGAVQIWHVANVANTSFCRLSVSKPAVGTGPGIDGDLWEIGSDGGYVQYPFKRFSVYSTAPVSNDGGEGEGGIDHPSQALIQEMYAGILLFPAERMTVAFTPIGQAGDKFTIQWWDWFRGRHQAVWNSSMTQILLPDDPMDGSYPTVPYVELTLQGNDPGTGEWVPNFLIPFPDIAPTPPARILPMTFGHGLPDPTTGDVMLFAQADFSGSVMRPLPTALVGSFEAHDVSVGEQATWEVTNLTHGDHDFHTHGFFFELYQYEFQDSVNLPAPIFHTLFPRLSMEAPPRKIKDTIRIPARLGAKGTSKTIARLIAHFDDTGREGQVVAEGERATFDRDGNTSSGGWLAHCHLLEHSAKGMLSFFEVRDPNQPFELLGKHLAGTRGDPYLTARGDRSSGVSFDLVNALPNKEVFLLGSHMLFDQPYKGGTLIPMPNLFSMGMTRLRVDVTDDEGNFTWDFPAKARFQTYWQVLFRDPGAPQGWAMSNAVMVR